MIAIFSGIYVHPVRIDLYIIISHIGGYPDVQTSPQFDQPSVLQWQAYVCIQIAVNRPPPGISTRWTHKRGNRAVVATQQNYWVSN